MSLGKSNLIGAVVFVVIVAGVVIVHDALGTSVFGAVIRVVFGTAVIGFLGYSLYEMWRSRGPYGPRNK